MSSAKTITQYAKRLGNFLTDQRITRLLIVKGNAAIYSPTYIRMSKLVKGSTTLSSPTPIPQLHISDGKSSNCYIWCTTHEKGPYAICGQRRSGSACASAQYNLGIFCWSVYYSFHWFCKQTTKALISLRLCAGWSRPALSANYIRALFVPYNIKKCWLKIDILHVLHMRLMQGKIGLVNAQVNWKPLPYWQKSILIEDYLYYRELNDIKWIVPVRKYIDIQFKT